MTCTIKALHILSFFSLLYKLALCQTTSISGVINTYTEVFSTNVVTNSVSVADPTNFATNDTVLLIKMQGAQIDGSNSASFGDLVDLNAVGAYELAVICSILGNEVSFHHQMINNYTPLASLQGKMQMIKVPQYQRAEVNGTLTAAAWDGSTGGVLVLQASERIILNADIDLDGLGFRGGMADNSSFSCNFLTNTNDYYYSVASGQAGRKGEGIAEYILGRESGRANQANGGGGGNDHNAGGGGGSNYGGGGLGGERVSSGFFDCKGRFPGLGGGGLQNSGYSLLNNRIFMGGGGGAGHINSNQGDDGAAGGGIIILITDTLEANGFAIRANGGDGNDVGSDGGPGGGAGGVVLLSLNGMTNTNLQLQARGGNGGGTNLNQPNCEGPGGGGGGGLIWTSIDLNTNPFVNIDVQGGSNGTSIGMVCPGAANGATAGTAGLMMSGWSMPLETIQATPCILSTDQLTLRIEESDAYVKLLWETNRIDEQDIFVIEHSWDGLLFQRMAEYPTASLNRNQNIYGWRGPRSRFQAPFYRIRQLRIDGSLLLSNIVELTPLPHFEARLYPNPVSANQPLSLKTWLPESAMLRIHIFNIVGQGIMSQQVYLEAGWHELSISPPTPLSKGMYVMRVYYQGQMLLFKLNVD